MEAEKSYPPARLSIIKHLMYSLDSSHSEEAILPSITDGFEETNISELEQLSTRYK